MQAAKDFDIDVKNSFVIGDLDADVGLGRAVGCCTILVGALALADGYLLPDVIVPDILAAVREILKRET